MLAGAAFQRGQQRVEIVDEHFGGAFQLHAEAGVEHIRRGHAGMDEARFRPDDLGKVRQERDDVMLHLPLDRVDPGDVEHRVAAALP
jgi:hypothetical protein